MKRKSIFINRDMIEGFVCDDVYTSYMMTGDELLNEGEHMINCNVGTLKAGARLAGSAHEEMEIYYVVDCAEGAKVVTGQDIPGEDEETVYDVKPGDFIVIPGGVFHWIDNRTCDKEFTIMTMWPKQEQNGCYFARKEAWGKSFKFKK